MMSGRRPRDELPCGNVAVEIFLPFPFVSLGRAARYALVRLRLVPSLKMTIIILKINNVCKANLVRRLRAIAAMTKNLSGKFYFKTNNVSRRGLGCNKVNNLQPRSPQTPSYAFAHLISPRATGVRCAMKWFIRPCASATQFVAKASST